MSAVLQRESFPAISFSFCVGKHSSQVPEVVQSPTVDLGRDFDMLLRRCRPKSERGDLPVGDTTPDLTKGEAINTLEKPTRDGTSARLDEHDEEVGLPMVKPESVKPTAMSYLEPNPAHVVRKMAETPSGSRAAADDGIIIGFGITSSEIMSEIGDKSSFIKENQSEVYECNDMIGDVSNQEVEAGSRINHIIGNLPGGTTERNAGTATIDKTAPHSSLTERVICYPSWKCNKKGKKEKKQQGLNKKWKVPNGDAVEVGFAYVRAKPRFCIAESTKEMEAELDKFERESADKEAENEHSNIKSTGDDLHLKTDLATDQNVLSEEKRQILAEVAPQNIMKTDNKDVYDVDVYQLILEMESKVSSKSLAPSIIVSLEYTGLKHPLRLRRKKKWAVNKAHKQVQTKYCQSLSNVSHGKKLLINHRIVKRMPLLLDTWRRPYTQSMRQIDIRKGYKRDVKLKGEVNRPGEGELRGRSVGSGRGLVGRNDKADPPPPAYALSSYNADRQIEQDLVNVLVNIQHRELTPEDYDLLLRLDERVAPKTVSEHVIEQLRSDIVGAENVDDVCSVCLEEYEIGQKRKHLPCGHVFHDKCIVNWLQNSSMNCPLDGVEVQ